MILSVTQIQVTFMQLDLKTFSHWKHGCSNIQGGPKTDTSFISGITSVIQHRF